MANETYSGTYGSGAVAGVWSAIVTINSVDQSARIVGDIRIDAEEDSARIAELVIRPPASTTFTIAGWVGKSITIDVADVSSGSPANVQRLFTGIIDTPSLDLINGTIDLRCTDNLQNIVEAMSDAAIDAAITGGYASPVIFDRAARGWSRSQDRLSTVGSSMDMTPAGALRVTSWTPKVTPDILFTAAHLLDQSPAVSLASRNQMVNRVDIDFGYRFPRVKSEGFSITWSYVSAATISAFAAALNWFLRRDAVDAAIHAAGGTIDSITYDPLPSSTIGSWTPGPDDVYLCMGFTAVVSFDYGQTIEEQFAITVSAPNSIAAVGTLKDRLSGALEGLYLPIAAAEHAMLLYKNDISGVPPQDTAAVIPGSTNSANVTLTTDTDRSAANAAMQALIAVAKTRIWRSHRNNSVSAQTPLNPAVDLDKTIDINVTGLQARGKCRSVSHHLSPATGRATTDFSVAICSVAGVGTTHADTANTAPTGSSPGSSTLAGSPSIVFNYAAAADHIITMTFPAVASGERNIAVVPLTSSYSAGLTEDILTITL